MQLRNNRNNEWQKITKRMLFWSSAMVTDEKTPGSAHARDCEQCGQQ